MMARARSRLSPLDAAFLYFEDPTQPMHVGCVAFLDGPVAFDHFVALIRQRLLPFERYRQRPARPTFDLGWPVWETAPNFDPRRHVRHVAVCAPGDLTALHDLIDDLFATALDPAHPLWEAYLIDGLADGRSAMLMKVHHCMIDGVSGAQLLEVLSDSIAEAAHPTPRPRGRAAASAGGLLGRLGAVLDPTWLRQQLGTLREALTTTVDLATSRLPVLPFNGSLSGRRRIVWSSFSMNDILRLRGIAGCKVNDVVLATITGALRRYLEPLRQVEDLGVRALVPVSVRSSDEHLALGNLVSAMIPTLPVGIADPLRRLRAVAAHMADLKRRGQPVAAGLMMQLVGTLPAPVEAALGRMAPSRPLFNTVCTNVPGPREPRRLLDRRILEIHPIVPLFRGMGLEFAMMSYGSTMSITAAADPALVDDAGRVADSLALAFEELDDALADAAEPARTITVGAAGGRPNGESVGTLMTREVRVVTAEASLGDAWNEMQSGRVRHVPVIDAEHRLLGLVTHRDVLGHAPSDLSVRESAIRARTLMRIPVRDVMETHVSTTTPTTALIEAGRCMLDARIGCLPVLDADGRLVGIVTKSDFVRWAMHPHADAAAPDAHPIAH